MSKSVSLTADLGTTKVYLPDIDPTRRFPQGDPRALELLRQMNIATFNESLNKTPRPVAPVAEGFDDEDLPVAFPVGVTAESLQEKGVRGLEGEVGEVSFTPEGKVIHKFKPRPERALHKKIRNPTEEQLESFTDFEEITIDGKRYGVNANNDVIDDKEHYVGDLIFDMFDRPMISYRPPPKYWSRLGDTGSVSSGGSSYAGLEEALGTEPKTRKLKKPGETPNLKDFNDFQELNVNGFLLGVNAYGDMMDADGNYRGQFQSAKAHGQPDPHAQQPWYWDYGIRDEPIPPLYEHQRLLRQRAIVGRLQETRKAEPKSVSERIEEFRLPPLSSFIHTLKNPEQYKR